MSKLVEGIKDRMVAAAREAATRSLSFRFILIESSSVT